ncbi:MAG: asparagine synthase (glutamine-hydrolyzing) [Chitinophagaceae bacterium]|nr:asparagine synthase (glutamine-hydrolyzing) [Chitinophagaceae bacterium]
MCRIAGIYSRTSTRLLDDVIIMRDSMQRGGPDDKGIYVDKEFPLVLAHRRLALIDLSPAGHQPMADNNDQLQIIFNGEIYNFQEIKTGLQAKGHQFKTKSDTEVILKAYMQYGKECFKMFNGMFAIALLDKNTSELLLVRDHAGIKPLYYHLTQDTLVFASEIRAFKAYKPDWPENPDWKMAFLTFGHLPEPITTLKDVTPLEKGTIASINLNTLQVNFIKFNRFSFTNKITDLHEAVSLIRTKLEQAVARHLISDAPIGVFLSGGIDSSLITLLAHRTIPDHLKTLSIVFEEQGFSEQSFQQIIVDKTGVDHHSFLVTRQQFGDALPDILAAMDQPSTDGINSYFICKYAKAYGLTAVLSGLGADELFGGYNSFNRTGISDLLQKQPPFFNKMASYLPGEKLKKVSFLQRKDLVGQFLFNRGFFSFNQVASMLQVTKSDIHDMLEKVVLEELQQSTNGRHRVSWIETNLYMQNQLLKDTDYMSMWHSLEVRVPFLDKELMEAVYSIDASIMFDKNILKHLLIKAFEDILPAEIWQRKKMGFTFPFNSWMETVASNSESIAYKKVRNQFVNKKVNWSRYWATVLSEPEASVEYRR